MNNQHKKSIYEHVATYSLSILVLLLPIFFIPKLHVGFLSAKFGLIFLCVGISCISLILHIIHERKITIPSPIYLYTAILLPTVYLISSLFSKDKDLSLIGLGADTDTFFFITLGSVLTVLVAVFFRSKQKISIISLGLIYVSACISFFHIIRFLFGEKFLSFGIFNIFTANTVGGFNDLGIFTGLILILLLLSLDFLSLNKTLRYSMYVATAFSLIVTCVSNFYITHNLFGLGIPVSLVSILALFALVIFVHKKVSSPKDSMPYVTFIVFIITLAFTIQGQSTSYIQQAIGIAPETVMDVRIAPLNTAILAKQVYGEGVMSTLFGTGPNRFYTAWSLYKPQEINQTILWNTNFNTGFGYVPTSAVTVGLLGICAWFIYLLMVMYSVYALSKLLLKKTKDQLTIYTALVAMIATAYLWFMVFAHTPSVVILVLTFFFTGLLIALLVQEEIIPLRVISWETLGYWKSFGIVFTLVVIITGIVSVGYVWSNKLIASVYADKAISALQQENPDITQVQAFMDKTISFSKSRVYLRMYTDLFLVRPTQLIASSKGVVPQSDITSDIANDVYKALATAEYAALGDVKNGNKLSADYQDWIGLGKVYETASFLGATSTPTLAVQAYAQAGILNPKNPAPLFLIGHIFAYTKEKNTAIEYLTKALDLKPDLVEAQALLKELKGSGISKTIETSTSTTTASTTDSIDNDN